MSMILFTLCLNPLIWRLERDLQGIEIVGKAKTAVVAYADELTIFLTDPREIPKLEESLQWYARASGATLNVRKSKAMALGTWDTSVNVINIPYTPRMTILGFTYTSSIAKSSQASWDRATGIIRGMAKESYGTDLCLTQRVRYVQVYFLAKIWHIAQVFPIT